jgi:EmrB/QacA subfamily drug resistance transporter
MHSPQNEAPADKSIWYALFVQCLGVSMVVLDATIVNVALPSIQADLGLSPSSLVWVVNAYLVPYGGFLLLCGRLGDRYGHHRIFLPAITLFTAASLGCGIATSSELLVGARVVQGLAAAGVSSVSLSLIAQQFPEMSTRSRALAIYCCVCASGGCAGVVLGGILTSELNWRWIFLVNVPVGITVCLLYFTGRLPKDPVRRYDRLDVAGSVLVTTSALLTIFSILSPTTTGSRPYGVLLPLCGALVSFSLFLRVESRATFPIVPLSFFRYRNLTVSVIAGALWAAAHATWCFVSAFQLKLIFNYEALEIGLAFLPATLIMAVFPLGLSGRLAIWFGAKSPFIVGLLLVAAGLAFLAQTPLSASFLTNTLPGMVLVGLGWGIAYSPFLLSALSEVNEGDYGLASGVVNSSTVMGGALALSFVTHLSDFRATGIAAIGTGAAAALNHGYNLAFGAGAAFAATAALTVVVFLRRPEISATTG